MTSEPLQAPLLKTLSDRGFMYQSTDLKALDELACAGPIVAYLGFDATAPSLHVGSLLQIMLLRWLKRYGHKVIVLVGGGTTRVGDPSGKEESRPLLTEDDIAHNIQGIRSILIQFLQGEDQDLCLLDNHEWLKSLGYLDTLRTYGRHLSVNRMMSFESVKLRLEREQHLSFLEFNYMVLQAIDFVVLHQQYGCRLQMGGADQWGNILCGVELGRKLGLPPLFGLTTPLLTTAQGQKMGKTAAGAMWLSADRLSPYDYWQFWRNTDDGDVIRFLKLFTEVPLEDIQKFETLSGQELNQAKICLADHATLLCHGEGVLASIHQQVQHFFNPAASEHQKVQPDVVLSDQEKNTLMISDLMIRLGWLSSKSESRRMIRQGGVKMNDQIIQDELAQVKDYLSSDDASFLLSMGKKKHAMIALQASLKNSSF